MMQLSKQEAREAVQAHVGQMTYSDYVASAEAVYEHVYALLAQLQAHGKLQNILSYCASPQWGEVDLLVLEREFKNVRFDYIPVSAQAPLPATLYDVVLVPLYGFNAEGYRLGHGSGWYDKFLPGQPHAFKIGVGLEANRTAFTADAHDIPMDIIITEIGRTGTEHGLAPNSNSITTASACSQ